MGHFLKDVLRQHVLQNASLLYLGKAPFERCLLCKNATREWALALSREIFTFMVSSVFMIRFFLHFSVFFRGGGGVEKSGGEGDRQQRDPGFRIR